MSKISKLKTIHSIFKLEAKLAGLSVFPLLLNLCMLFVMLLTLWLSGMLLIGYFSTLILGTFTSALFLVILLNLGLLFGLVRYLNYNLKNMSFEKTRSFLSPKVSTEDDKLKKAIDRKHSPVGKRIATPTGQRGRAQKIPASRD